LFVIFPVYHASSGSVDATRMQQAALERMEEARTQFRRTGQYNESIPLLQQAVKELQSSYESFIQSGEMDSAVFTLLKLGVASRNLSALQMAQDRQIGPRSLKFMGYAKQFYEEALRLG